MTYEELEVDGIYILPSENKYIRCVKRNDKSGVAYGVVYDGTEFAVVNTCWAIRPNYISPLSKSDVLMQHISVGIDALQSNRELASQHFMSALRIYKLLFRKVKSTQNEYY